MNNAHDVRDDVTLNVNGQNVTVRGPKGTLSHTLHREVEMTRDDADLKFAPRSGSKPAMAQAGTARALINNLVTADVILAFTVLSIGSVSSFC